MARVIQAFDGLKNLVANLGTDRDKASHTEYEQTTLRFFELREAYRHSWLARKVIDIPPLDMTREWRTWSNDNGDISKEEKRLGLRNKVREALVGSRLFGGAAILIGTGDEDLMEPLDVSRIGLGGLKYLTVLDRRDLVPGSIDYRVSSEDFGKPMWYDVVTQGGHMHRLHPSRLAKFYGARKPDSGATRIDPWGDSVLEYILDIIKYSDSTFANVASLVFEAKVDTIGIPDLMRNLRDPETEKLIQDRLSLAMRAKGINGTLLHDSEEIIGQKQASFSQIPDVMDRFLQAVAGAADIPMTRLAGMSPAGQNSTGEHDLENYYNRIRADQELEVSTALSLLDQALIASAFGSIPDDVEASWSPLWQPSQKERIEAAKGVSDAASQLSTAMVFPEDTLARVTAKALIETGAFPGMEDELDRIGDAGGFEGDVSDVLGSFGSSDDDD